LKVEWVWEVGLVVGGFRCLGLTRGLVVLATNTVICWPFYTDAVLTLNYYLDHYEPPIFYSLSLSIITIIIQPNITTIIMSKPIILFNLNTIVIFISFNSYSFLPL
jgi:hypothetical protein